MSWLVELSDQRWLAPPLQSQFCTTAPSVWLAPLTSRHRFEPAPRISPVGVPGEPTAVTERLSNWAVTPWPVPYPIWPATQVESVAVPTVDQTRTVPVEGRR